MQPTGGWGGPQGVWATLSLLPASPAARAQGWDEGCRGMRPGEVRKLVCPPKLAYGARGSLPEIPPNATLTFEITYVGPANDVGADEEP